MKHPSEESLALFSGGELPCWQEWWVKRHVAECDDCALEVDAYRNASAGVALLGPVRTGLDWETLEAEMRANIHLGLEAGEIVGKPWLRQQPLGWRAAVALASVTILMLAGYFIYFPRGQRDSMARNPGTPPIVLESTPGSVEVKQGGAGLALLHPENEPVTLSVNAQGGVGARYIDTETGYVTTSNVYVEE